MWCCLTKSFFYPHKKGRCIVQREITSLEYLGSSSHWSHTIRSWAQTLGFTPSDAFCLWLRTWPSTWSAFGTLSVRSASSSWNIARFTEETSKLSSSNLWRRFKYTGEKTQLPTNQDFWKLFCCSWKWNEYSSLISQIYSMDIDLWNLDVCFSCDFLLYIKTQVITKTKTFFCETQVFETFAGHSVNKGFSKLRKSCWNSGKMPQNSVFRNLWNLECIKNRTKKPDL